MHGPVPVWHQSTASSSNTSSHSRSASTAHLRSHPHVNMSSAWVKQTQSSQLVNTIAYWLFLLQFQSEPQSPSNTAVFGYWMNPRYWTNQASQWFSNLFIGPVPNGTLNPCGLPLSAHFRAVLPLWLSGRSLQQARTSAREHPSEC